MKRVYREMMQYKIALFFVLLTVIGNVLTSLALPAYLSSIINQAIPEKNIPQIMSIGGAMLIFVALGTVCNIATGYFSSKISMAMGRNFRSQIFCKIQYFSQREFDCFSTSSFITRTNHDVIQIQNFVNMALRVSLTAPFMCVGGVIMAFQKNSTMSLILIVSIPVMAVFILIIARYSTPLSQKMQEKIDRINLVTREKLTGIRVARAFGTEEYEAQRFDGANRDFMENAVRMNLIMGVMIPGLNLVLYATTVALLLFGAYGILNNASGIPIGDVIAVIQYVMQIMMAVMLLSMVFVMYPRAYVSAKRIGEVLETEPSVRSSETPAEHGDEHGIVEFKNVTFSFPGGDEPAIKNISFYSGPGEVTAVIGSTGSGKSSLINLIPRFYDVQEGEVLVNGINVRDYDLDTLRRKIGLVPQKAFLFQGTIAENIGFGLEHPADEPIVHAAKIAQSYDFITAKEGGFESPISQGGTNVSGGQKQRLAIARAIVRKPEIYVFDDSFSALDFKTDAALRGELMKEAKDSTVILVAQRVSTILHADRILVLENGECVGQGRHTELLKTCGVYREIVYSQLGKEEA